MGYLKQKQLEDEQKWYRSGTGKFVCDKHFGDYALKNFIKNNASQTACDYCDKEDYEDESFISVPLDNIIDLIVKGIKTEYGHADDEGLSYESAEGGYIGEVFDSYDLISEEVEIEDEDLFNDIWSNIDDISWCHLNPYSLTPTQELISYWEKFCNLIKHKVRFVFYKKKYNRPRSNEELKNPYEILEIIGETVNNLGLIKSTSEGIFKEKKFIRARQHSSADIVDSCKTLGPPPPKSAKVNRMSPAGIPMFYCGEKEFTTIKEIIDLSDSNNSYITIGVFRNLKELNFIDLTNLPYISLFDFPKNEHRSALAFLKAFVKDISKPIDRIDGKEHIDYVPTQVVTEYFRHLFPEVFGKEIHGIKFPSSKDKNSSCYVLFFEQEDFTQDDICLERKERKKKYMELIKSTLKTLEVSKIKLDLQNLT